MEPIGQKIKLTLPLLEEINQFSRLNLQPSRVDTVPCFSDALINVHICNPDVSPEDSEPVCSIHWACKLFLGGRLGIGLQPGEPYNFEKSKEFCKQLTYAKLVEAIKSKIGEAEAKSPAQLTAESITEEQLHEAEIQKPTLETIVVKPTKTMTAKSEGPAVSKEAIGTYKPGSQGHFILSNLPVGSNCLRSEILEKVVAKGWSSEKTFDKTVAKLVEEKLVEMPEPTILVRKV